MLTAAALLVAAVVLSPAARLAPLSPTAARTAALRARAALLSEGAGSEPPASSSPTASGTKIAIRVKKPGEGAAKAAEPATTAVDGETVGGPACWPRDTHTGALCSGARSPRALPLGRCGASDDSRPRSAAEPAHTRPRPSQRRPRRSLYWSTTSPPLRSWVNHDFDHFDINFSTTLLLPLPSADSTMTITVKAAPKPEVVDAPKVSNLPKRTPAEGRLFEATQAHEVVVLVVVIPTPLNNEPTFLVVVGGRVTL